MDENKRDELQSEEAEVQATEETAAEEVTENVNELAQELEDLRDMFQQELDKATEESENQTETLIQELDEIEDIQEEEEFTGRLCEICGEKPCAEEYGEDYPYCEDCRNIMKKYPMRASGILMSILMLAVFVATGYAGTSYFDAFMSVSEYAAYYDTGKVMTALNGYYSYTMSTDPATISMKAVKDSIDGFDKTGYISDATQLIQQVYSEKQLKLPWNKKYAKMVEKSEALTESYYTIAEIITPIMNGETDDYEKVMAQLDALYELKDQDGNAVEINRVFLEYYRYVVMSVLGKDNELLLTQLEKAAAADEDGSLGWVYLSNYATVAAKSGDLKLTEKLYKKMLDANAEDTAAYIALASYYRFIETPDPDKILEICEEAKANAYSGDLTYMPYMAIAYLFKGEGATALETMDEYMSMSGYTVQTCNLYALCAAYNGNDEIYNEMKDVLENAGYEMSVLVEKYKNDKITIEEALKDMGGDI